VEGTNAVSEDDELPLRVIARPLEHFDAIGFVARRVEDFAVAYALEGGAHQSDSQNVAGRIYVIFLYTDFQNFYWRWLILQPSLGFAVLPESGAIR
jgi:hypothetical protein